MVGRQRTLREGQSAPVVPLGAVQVTGFTALGAEALVTSDPTGRGALLELAVVRRRGTFFLVLGSVVGEQRLVVIHGWLRRWRMRRG